MGIRDWYARARKQGESLIAEYGKVAIGTLIVVRITELAAVWAAIEMGFQPDSAAGTAGTFWAAMAVTQGTKPIRLGFVVVATPFVARLLRQSPNSQPSQPDRSPESQPSPAVPPAD